MRKPAKTTKPANNDGSADSRICQEKQEKMIKWINLTLMAIIIALLVLIIKSLTQPLL